MNPEHSRYPFRYPYRYPYRSAGCGMRNNLILQHATFSASLRGGTLAGRCYADTQSVAASFIILNDTRRLSLL